MKLPIDFENRMKEMLGEEWEDFLYCYENDKYQALRINPIKVDEDKENAILKIFNLCDSERVPWEARGVYYGEDIRPGKHPYHEMGLYYIQEPSAMSAVSLLDVRPGMRVLDLCAAPGGKSTQIAGKLMGKGLLVSNEINPARSKILSQNIERLGIGNAIVTNEDSGKLASKYPAFFHRILVDAPCSGEGMFRKLPEAVEEWSLENVRICGERQEEILDNAAEMLMPGGRLVYSTCTFAPVENEKSIAKFLERHDDFTIVETKLDYFEPGRPEWGDGNLDLKKTYRLWPHKLKGEGHYVAVLQKAGEETAKDFFARSKKGTGKSMTGDQLKMVEDFFKKSISQEVAQEILSGELALFKDQLYRLPDNSPDIKGIHVLRAGLHLGEFKKNRFEPGHSLALFLKKEDALNAIDFSSSDERAVRYFNGESISLNYEETELGIKSWTLVCIDGFPVAWGKTTGATVKNHYPKGLRKIL